MQTASFSEIRYGIFVDSIDLNSDPGPAHRWYVFEKAPYSSELVAGCVRASLKSQDSRTLIPLDEQAESAAECYSSRYIVPILIGRWNNVNTLYIPLANGEIPYSGVSDIDYRIQEWTSLGHLRYATRSFSALARLKWIGTSWYAAFPTPSGMSLPPRSPDIAKRMLNHLNEIAINLADVIHSKCDISGTQNKGIIRFQSENGQELGILEYKDNNAAVKILRTPYVDGSSLMLGDKLLTWNPLKDITYSSGCKSIKMQVEKGIFERKL